MTPDDLKARTKKFAVDVIRFAKAIPRDHINDEIASQLTDAATSTAAYYRAVCRARSRADFINKLAAGSKKSMRPRSGWRCCPNPESAPSRKRRRCGERPTS